MDFATVAETRASAAERYGAFRGFSLLKTREVVTELLNHIGRTPPFAEYTAHDISHIDRMLESLTWVIPPGTQRSMSPSDWLLIVLACYFHDLGLLVTRDEFDARAESGFDEFCEGYLTVPRIDILDAPARQLFLYQEFVRHHHAARVWCWVSGRPDRGLGVARVAEEQISGLLQPLGPVFREDLALVCLSHHLEDLGDLVKYPVRRPYGNTPEETGNVQYAAIILRTVDLLHITKDRVPSVRHTLIAPRDPVSQTEWAKQQAVRSVRPQPKRDAEGRVTTEQSDTIEVHAKFTEPEAFFALDAYLTYARDQVKRSTDWAEQARRMEGVPHDFPWRHIDSSGVEAEGFLPREFRFEIDQANILDLLTGHTLYNDPTVAIRELLQNSLDAVRLQRLTGPVDSASLEGFEILITWDESARTLTVADAGTGMTQRQVEENFLRVGASRYQTQEFKKQFPEFAPISRFGIGVLSTFMIADCVDVFTRGPGDSIVRHLKLRDVHGRYLVREILPPSPDIPAGLASSGTVVQLQVRSDVPLIDPLAIARSWMIAPNATIGYRSAANGMSAVRVGADNVAATLAHFMSERQQRSSFGLGAEAHGWSDVRVVTEEAGPVEVAMGVIWNSYFRTWEFLPLGSLRRRQEGFDSERLATCVEGIRVVSEAPGFELTDLRRDEAYEAPAAYANATGMNAPRTNVARSGLEAGAAASDLWRSVYACYCRRLEAEHSRLTEVESYSPSRAVAEIRLQASRLLRCRASEPVALRAALSMVPLFIIEDEENRRAISLRDLDELGLYYSMESSLITSLENVLRSVPGALSLREMAQRLSIPVDLPPGTSLPKSWFEDAVEGLRLAIHEPTFISASSSDGAVRAGWGRRSEKPSRWLSGRDLARAQRDERPQRGSAIGRLFVPVDEELTLVYPDGVYGVRVGEATYLKDDLGLREYWVAAVEAIGGDGDGKVLRDAAALLEIVFTLLDRRVTNTEAEIERLRDAVRAEFHVEKDVEGLIPQLVERLGTSEVLDPGNWLRRSRRDMRDDDVDW